MATGWLPTVKEIDGVNLDNYFPHGRSYNSVVFLHKRCLNKTPPKEQEYKAKYKKENKLKHDQGQQFNGNKIMTDKYRVTKARGNNDYLLEQTIKFAKNIVPLAIPQSDDQSPVFYTVKTSKKSKTHRKCRECSFENHDATFDKGETKKGIATHRKVKSHKESYSVKESISHTSNNTFDDLNNNQSLCCTLSELSEKKLYKNEHYHQNKKLKKHRPKCAVSESFEALATETVSGDTKIKIHLMNEKDKKFLSDSIRIPIINAITDCVAELNSHNQYDEVTTVHRIVKCNTHKLDNVLEKLACIEKKIDAYKAETRSPRMPITKVKTSKLEELGADLFEVKNDLNSSEEEIHHEILDQPESSTVVEYIHEEMMGKANQGRGEEVPCPTKPSTSIGPQPDRPNRIPARFCWTDAKRKN